MSDLAKLSGPGVPPASGGPARQLVILLHGVGADGDDLISLADYWSALLPDAEFISPNAPDRCDMSPYGYQWFSLLDRSMSAMTAGVKRVAPVIDAYIDQALAERGLTADKLALVGFSQGTMTSLYVALRRSDSVAAVLGYSGALLAPDLLAGEIKSRPPVLLVHGDADQVVPPQALPAAQAVLQAAGVPVEVEVRPGLGHGIDQDGLTRGGFFLKRALLG
ncbi:dienelactone hydrolase family protein [Skermanella sp. TT6]|uniref:Dienelactone hydrolase family protein n=1 Tax=Skermanella cutis TaxID=2775420 RepID=A0ABX7BAL8_9PROT|nr:alpha/beta fold hydrolase [Skermanella sp. TT6]QQP91423.1 dienelactone hydrolase family protein [Skermanella sp. TT6]